MKPKTYRMTVRREVLKPLKTYRMTVRHDSRRGSYGVKVLAISRAHARSIAAAFGFTVVSVRAI